MDHLRSADSLVNLIGKVILRGCENIRLTQGDRALLDLKVTDMSKFNPSMLVPSRAAGTSSSTRSAKDVALANIAKMKEQMAAGDGAEGKANFKAVDGGRVAFTIRVSNTPLVLEKVKVEDTDVEVREMTIPAANFNDALDYYADRIKAGEYDAQLTTLSEKEGAAHQQAA